MPITNRDLDRLDKSLEKARRQALLHVENLYKVARGVMLAVGVSPNTIDGYHGNFALKWGGVWDVSVVRFEVDGESVYVHREHAEGRHVCSSPAEAVEYIRAALAEQREQPGPDATDADKEHTSEVL
jgi:hypothetical protein